MSELSTGSLFKRFSLRVSPSPRSASNVALSYISLLSHFQFVFFSLSLSFFPHYLFSLRIYLSPSSGPRSLANGPSNLPALAIAKGQSLRAVQQNVVCTRTYAVQGGAGETGASVEYTRSLEVGTGLGLARDWVHVGGRTVGEDTLARRVSEEGGGTARRCDPPSPCPPSLSSSFRRFASEFALAPDAPFAFFF